MNEQPPDHDMLRKVTLYNLQRIKDIPNKGARIDKTIAGMMNHTKHFPIFDAASRVVLYIRVLKVIDKLLIPTTPPRDKETVDMLEDQRDAFTAAIRKLEEEAMKEYNDPDSPLNELMNYMYAPQPPTNRKKTAITQEDIARGKNSIIPATVVCGIRYNRQPIERNNEQEQSRKKT